MDKYQAVNARKCNDCGDVIISWHRHDFVYCRCGKNFTDGGFDYTHCTTNTTAVPLYLKLKVKGAKK